VTGEGTIGRRERTGMLELIEDEDFKDDVFSVRENENAKPTTCCGTTFETAPQRKGASIRRYPIFKRNPHV
jgi:hypothetical protein